MMEMETPIIYKYVLICGLIVISILFVDLIFLNNKISKFFNSQNQNDPNNVAKKTKTPRVYKARILNVTENEWVFDSTDNNTFINDVRTKAINVVMINTNLYRIRYKTISTIKFTSLQDSNNQIPLPINTELHMIGWSMDGIS